MTRVLVNKPQPLEARFAQERDRVQVAVLAYESGLVRVGDAS